MAAVVKSLKHLGERIENAIIKHSSGFYDKDKYSTGCRKCHGNVPSGKGNFCSQKCALEYWEGFQSHYRQKVSSMYYSKPTFLYRSASMIRDLHVCVSAL